MPFSQKSASSISEADLLGLVESQEAEGKELEYKGASQASPILIVRSSYTTCRLSRMPPVDT
jgi:hypothetical protein